MSSSSPSRRAARTGAALIVLAAAAVTGATATPATPIDWSSALRGLTADALQATAASPEAAAEFVRQMSARLGTHAAEAGRHVRGAVLRAGNAPNTNNATQRIVQNKYDQLRAYLSETFPAAQSDELAQFGVTPFSALDPSERAKFTGFVPPASLNPARRLSDGGGGRELAASVPASYDMRSLGLLVPVKNQGSCGCCWAFAGTNAIETALVVGGGPLASLSEQEYLNCAGYDACAGGNAWGGWASLLQTSNGQVTEATMPYTTATASCDLTLIDANGVAAIPPVNNDEYNNVYTESGYELTTEAAVMSYIHTTGSVVMSLSANCFYTYTSGIITPSNCNACDSATGPDVRAGALDNGGGGTPPAKPPN